jgi:hypothetical protein
MMAENPDLILGLHEEIKMGRYDKVAPIALKMKAMDTSATPKADLEYYMEAVNAFIAKEETAQVVNKSVKKQEDIVQKADARKAAAPTKRMSGKRDVIDYLDDNDEDYDEWYKKVQSRQ